MYLLTNTALTEALALLFFFLTVPGPSPATNKVFHRFIPVVWPAGRHGGSERTNYSIGNDDHCCIQLMQQVKPTLENLLHIASLLCPYPRWRRSRQPSRTPANSRCEKWKAENTSVFSQAISDSSKINMAAFKLVIRMEGQRLTHEPRSWFQITVGELLLRLCVFVFMRPNPSPLRRRFCICLCALMQSWCIAPHVAVRWKTPKNEQTNF